MFNGKLNEKRQGECMNNDYICGLNKCKSSMHVIKKYISIGPNFCCMEQKMKVEFLFTCF